MGGVKKMSQTEGAQQGTNHSQEQLSMGGSQGYIHCLNGLLLGNLPMCAESNRVNYKPKPAEQKLRPRTCLYLSCVKIMNFTICDFQTQGKSACFAARSMNNEDLFMNLDVIFKFKISLFSNNLYI